jgi:enamine deaminase RidA (YjgF/YER057c/UK114 family)
MTASDFIELIRAPRLTDRAPYAYAAVASDVRRLVFTAGACPLDEKGETVAVGDVAWRWLRRPAAHDRLQPD